MQFSIANLPGDGIGPAGANCWLKTGTAMSDNVFKACRDSHAIYGCNGNNWWLMRREPRLPDT